MTLVSLYVVAVTVARAAKSVHPAFWHRSNRYPVTPTLSVEAVQARSTRVLVLVVAVRFEGAVGA